MQRVEVSTMNKLKFTRQYLGYTQTDMARLLGLSAGEIYGKKENGLSNFTLDEGLLVADTLNITPKQVKQYMTEWVDVTYYCPSCKEFKESYDFYVSTGNELTKPCIECKAERNRYYRQKRRLKNENQLFR